MSIFIVWFFICAGVVLSILFCLLLLLPGWSNCLFRRTLTAASPLYLCFTPTLKSSGAPRGRSASNLKTTGLEQTHLMICFKKIKWSKMAAAIMNLSHEDDASFPLNVKEHLRCVRYICHGSLSWLHLFDFLCGTHWALASRSSSLAPHSSGNSLASS